MAIPVARVHLAMAHAALPALLPTPPKWKILTTLLPTPPCAVILPMPSPPKHKPSRADADQSWVASKSAISKSPSKPGRASSCERWDSNKKTTATTSSSSTSTGSSASRASSGDKWNSNMVRPVSVSRASSADRWDAHKKPARPSPPQQQQVADGIDDDDGQSSTGSNDMDELYAGPGFIVGPDPSMLPMPTLLMTSRVAAQLRAQ